jgi:type VI protein secretion system component Hcp
MTVPKRITMTNPGLLLQIDGIDGDCRHPRYGGWMNVLWFSFGGAGEFGQNRPAHSASMKMFAGRISPFLQIACLRGDRFRFASLVALNLSGEAERFHGAMEDVRITGFQYQGEVMERPIHSLELTFFSMEPREMMDVAPTTPRPATPPRPAMPPVRSRVR